MAVHKFGKLTLITRLLTFKCAIAGEVGRGSSSRAVGECAPRKRAQTEDRDVSACPCRFTKGGVIWSPVLFIETNKPTIRRALQVWL